MKLIKSNSIIQYETRSPRPIKKYIFITIIFSSMFSVSSQYAESSADVTGEGPNLNPRITQDQVASWPLPNIQKNGVRIFSTPFNFHDGFGDGPADPGGPLDEGGRPTLQSNGTFLRVNGRFINSPILFGVGGIELLAKEMTVELQELKQEAVEIPGQSIELTTKGVSFGTIVADGGGNIDTSGVKGIDEDLVGFKKTNYAILNQLSNSVSFKFSHPKINAISFRSTMYLRKRPFP